MSMEMTLGQMLHNTHTRIQEEARQRQDEARKKEEAAKVARFKGCLQDLRKSISATIFQGKVPEDIVFHDESVGYDGIVQAVSSRFDEPLSFARPGAYLDAWNEFVAWAAGQQLRINVTHPERSSFDDGDRPTLYDFTLSIEVALV